MPYPSYPESVFADRWYDLSLQQKIRDVKENQVSFTGTPHQADSWGMNLSVSQISLAGWFEVIEDGQY